MSVYRVNKTAGFTVMSNFHFKEKGMSLKAKGLLSLMLSLPEEWDYSTEGLAKLSSDGTTAVRSALKELENLGYLVRERVYENGRVCDWIYNIYERPVNLEKLEVENQPVENQAVENNAQLNTKQSNTKLFSTSNEVENKNRNKDIDAFISLYHKYCTSLPRVRGITGKRKKAIENIIKKFSRDDIITVFNSANNSDFLTGKNGRGWKANLDFILREDKFIKILEGAYSSSVGTKNRIEHFKKTPERYSREEKRIIKEKIKNGELERI